MNKKTPRKSSTHNQFIKKEAQIFYIIFIQKVI